MDLLVRPVFIIWRANSVKMKRLLTCMFCQLLFLGLIAQKQDAKKIQYYCYPCGCEYDGKLFETAGKCVKCGMRLMEVGTFNYEMPSVSRTGILVYASDKEDHKQKLFYKSVHSSGKGKFITEGSMPKVSADGKKILFNRKENSILVYDLAAKKLIDYTAKIKLPGLQTPSWGADGKSIVFAAGKFPNLGLYKMNLKDGQVEPIIVEEGLRYGSVMSPDGKKIACRAARGKSKESMQKGIVVYDLESRKEKYVTGIGEYCNWSPDGKRLAFHWPDSADFCIYVVKADGGELRKIAGAKGGDYELPCWSNDGKK